MHEMWTIAINDPSICQSVCHMALLCKNCWRTEVLFGVKSTKGSWEAQGTLFLQCSDTVGLVIWPGRIVPEMTYNVSGGTLSLYSLTHPRNTVIDGNPNPTTVRGGGPRNTSMNHSILPSPNYFGHLLIWYCVSGQIYIYDVWQQS